MSDFTNPLFVYAATYRHDETVPRWSFLPPAWLRVKWIVGRDLDYYVGAKEAPDRTIRVPQGFVFNGLSVPPPFTLLIPRSHPSILPAAALHDWLYAARPVSRAAADAILFDALIVLRTPVIWAWAIWFAVRAGGWAFWYSRALGISPGAQERVIAVEAFCAGGSGGATLDPAPGPG